MHVELTRLGPNKWTLREDWKSPFRVVPKGFVTDGASVPRLFWWFASPSGDLFEASVVHDFLYKNAIGTKAEADMEFKTVAKSSGANVIRVYVAYYLVKVFGRGSY